MPDEDAGGERDSTSSPAASRVASRRSGVLSGALRWASRSAATDSIIIPWLGLTGSEQRQFVGVQRAGVGVREQAGLGEHERSHRRDVVDGRVVAACPQPVAGDLVAVLRPLAEREQRLVASGAGTLAGDLQHLLRIEVGRFDPGRRLGERAVPAGVVAQERERDEHLRAVGDAFAERLVTACGGERHQARERGAEQWMVGAHRTPANWRPGRLAMPDWVNVTSQCQHTNAWSSGWPHASWTSTVGGPVVGQPLVAPAHQRDERRRQGRAHVGQPVLEPRRALAVQAPLEHAGLDQPLEAVGQDGTGDVEVGAEVVEPAHAAEGVAHDQDRPAVAEDVEAPLDRAGPIGRVGRHVVSHRPIVESSSPRRTKSVRFPNRHGRSTCNAGA